jgi:hypothetical protein
MTGDRDVASRKLIEMIHVRFDPPLLGVPGVVASRLLASYRW